MTERTYSCGTCTREIHAVTVPDYTRPTREGYALAPHGNLWGGECKRDRVRVACKCGQVEYADTDRIAAIAAVGGSPWRFCGRCHGRVRF